MAINSLQRIKAGFYFALQKNREGSADRDAHSSPGHDREKPSRLNFEQEEEARESLQKLLDSQGHGLTAHLVRSPDARPIALVTDASGKELRRLTYEQLIELFLSRKMEGAKGHLFAKKV